MNSSQLRMRFALTFVAGVIVASMAVTVGSRRTQASNHYEDLSLFSSVITLVRRNYVEPIDEHELLRGAVHGMLAALDPHSAFMEPDAFQEMQIDTRGEFHGLGIEITKLQGSFVEVVSPIEGTPAFRAGIKPRDQIVEICPTVVPDDWEEPCSSTKEMSLLEAVRLMRGKKDTEITVKIFREGFEEPRPFTIVRDVVQVASVSGKMLEDGYAYLRVRSFQERTADELDRELSKLEEEAPEGFDGLVIDLRDNPGGLLDQAVEVANRWLGKGLIVYTQGRHEAQRQEFRAEPESTQAAYPIVAIVNAGSASASEIVAGALQDHRRALVLGTSTFGKGSVQTVYPIGEGYGLRLTTALYYTPSGRSIQEVGIDPDIEVRPAPSAKLVSARRLRERDLDGHFTHEDADPTSEPVPIEEPLVDEGELQQESEDLQLTRAVEVLKSWSYFERLRHDRPAPAMTAEAPSVVAQ